jgi:hypothetical protein
MELTVISKTFNPDLNYKHIVKIVCQNEHGKNVRYWKGQIKYNHGKVLIIKEFDGVLEEFHIDNFLNRDEEGYLLKLFVYEEKEIVL